MDKKYREVDLEKALKITEYLKDHRKETRSFIADFDKRITNTNYLTNGGGAVAVLACLGSKSPSPLIEYSLVLFLAGVILTGIELRAMLKFWSVLYKDVDRRLEGFVDNELTIEQCLTPKGLGRKYQNINNYAGWGSQLCFSAGVIIGGIGFLLCST